MPAITLSNTQAQVLTDHLAAVRDGKASTGWDSQWVSSATQDIAWDNLLSILPVLSGAGFTPDQPLSDQ